MAFERDGGSLSPAELAVNPRVLSRLLRAFGERHLPGAGISALIRCDPALTLQLLLAGGASTQEEAEAFSLQACVDRVGLEVLEALLVQQSVRALGKRPDVGPHSALTAIWRRSLLCALTAEALAERAGQSTEAAYVAGLLHAVGKLAVLEQRKEYAQTLAAARSELELLRTERSTAVQPHDAVAALLVKDCEQPLFLADALALQRERIELLIDAPFLVRVVAIASRLLDEGASQAACSDGTLLLGVHERAVARALDDALEAAPRNPGAVDVARSLGSSPGVPGDDLAAPAADVEARGWSEVTHSLGQSGLRAVLRQALATAQGQAEALRRTRDLSGLLLGLGRQVVFVASAEERALKAVPLEDDPVQVRELSIPLATSRSLLATAARERRPVHAFGPALEEGGAAVDRVVARLLGAQGLLCIPLSSGSGVSGVVAAALNAPWDERGAPEAATLTVLTMAAADAVAQAAQRSREEERTRAEVTAQFRAMGKRVVHEAGNPLAIVKNYLQVLANKAAQSGEFREELTILNEELDRIARIVQRMGDPFAADGDGAGPLDLNALVREVVTLCNETLFAGRGIEVHQQLDPNLPLLRSEAGAIKQVVLNLMTNAAEAMPQGGRLMLLTSDNVNLDGELFVLLQVTDTGSGVAPEVLQRLFQHGVSTKGEGHEGIGLAVSEGIVRRLGGRILCRSSPGRGTIFGVLLPRRPARNDMDKATGASS
jgi:signal transduction histidine kinase/HD-like signal output (HDOD) protein